jgi:hypothetical protein
METSYSITDIEGFAQTIRDGAARSISKNYTENLDEFISVGQIISLVKDTSVGTDDDGLFMITEELFDEIFERIRETIYQVGLSKLAATGQIECAWDGQKNEMVFWLASKTHGNQHINTLPS